VGDVRKHLEATVQIGQLDRLLGEDGKWRKNTRKEPVNGAELEAGAQIAQAGCSATGGNLANCQVRPPAREEAPLAHW
jgi:hypothetical protein